MENQTSFIPKQILTRQVVQRSSSTGLFTLITVVVFIISALFLGGVYFYRFILKDDISRPCPSSAGDEAKEYVKSCGLEAALARIQQDLNDEQSLMQKIERLDSKIKRAKSLIAGHTTLLPLFGLLEKITLETVGYSNFSYDNDSIKLSGKARSYESIALQSEVFAKAPEVKSFVFSGLTSAEDDSVGFQLTIVIDPTIALYKKTSS